MNNKVIITCAITGATFTPTMSPPHLPYTVDDIVNNAVEAYKAGAAVLHLHTSDPQNGTPFTDPELFKEYAVRIKEKTNDAINMNEKR